MPDIQLVIADTALRDAILEQLPAVGLDPLVKKSPSLSSALSSGDGIVVLDDSAATKDNLKTLQSKDEAHKKRVILLGGFSDIADNPLVAGVFPKPFRMGQLVARLQFHAHVVPRLRNASISFGPYRLEVQARQIIVEGEENPVRLTEKETAILEYLGQSETPVGRDDLLSAVWGYDDRIDTHTLETHIYQLRRKLDPQAKRGDVLVHTEGGYFLKRG